MQRTKSATRNWSAPLPAAIILLTLTLLCGRCAVAQSMALAGGGASMESSEPATSYSGPASRFTVPSPVIPQPDADTNSSVSDSADDAAETSSSSSSAVAVSTSVGQEKGIAWKPLFASSAAFLAVSHTFRYTTESTTHNSFHFPFFPSYGNAVANMHGWSDGDPFMVNYVGHPMQGAVASFIWQHDDRAYRAVEFGRNTPYWKERMRGMAYAYVYSVQFEIGPFSEASIGHVQHFYPEVGFVDHVITPTIGTGWAIAEDAIDRMVVQRLEARFSNPYVRLLLRGGMNPARSFANMMGGNLPWHRDDRPGVFKPFPENAFWAAETKKRMEKVPANPPPGVAPFDFSFHATFRDYLNNANAGACMGGGGTAGFRLAEEWQWIVDVGGCKMLDFKSNWSGDALTYMTGPRWTPHLDSRWTPHVQFLIGGTKLTQQFQDPVLKAQVADWRPKTDEERQLKHRYYSTDWDTAGFAMQAGAGMDYRLNEALAVHVANLSYEHSWTNDINGFNYRNAVAVSGGLVLRMGTW